MSSRTWMSFRMAALFLFAVLSTNVWAGWENSDFCWMETYGRGAGEIPKSGPGCPDGAFPDPNGGCYSCPNGYFRTLFPPVTSDQACAKPFFGGYARATNRGGFTSCKNNAGKPEYDAGLCYPSCAQNYTGVGPVCWAHCPASHPVNCGMGCATTKEACAENVADQVLSVLEAVISLTGAKAKVTGVKELDAAKTMLNKASKGINLQLAAGVTREQLAATVRKQLISRGFEASTETVWAIVNGAASGDGDPTQIFANVITNLDPTGIGSILQAYVKPVCYGAKPYVAPPVQPKKLTIPWRTENVPGVGVPAGGLVGRALDVAVGPDGKPWVIVGYSGQYSTAQDTRIVAPSGAVAQPPAGKEFGRLDVDREGTVWAVTNDGNLYFGTAGGWTQAPVPENRKVVDVYTYWLQGVDDSGDTPGNKIIYVAVVTAPPAASGVNAGDLGKPGVTRSAAGYAVWVTEKGFFRWSNRYSDGGTSFAAQKGVSAGGMSRAEGHAWRVSSSGEVQAIVLSGGKFIWPTNNQKVVGMSAVTLALRGAQAVIVGDKGQLRLTGVGVNVVDVQEDANANAVRVAAGEDGSVWIVDKAGVVKSWGSTVGAPQPSAQSSAAPSSATQWIAVKNGQVPPNALVAGKHRNGAAMAVCRADMGDGVHPGKVWSGKCNVGWGGQEKVMPTFEVLVVDPNRIAWVAAQNGQVPPNALVAGKHRNGAAMAICRADMGDGIHAGKVWGGKCNVGWGGQEKVMPRFEVLVQK